MGRSSQKQAADWIRRIGMLIEEWIVVQPADRHEKTPPFQMALVVNWTKS